MVLSLGVVWRLWSLFQKQSRLIPKFSCFAPPADLSSTEAITTTTTSESKMDLRHESRNNLRGEFNFSQLIANSRIHKKLRDKLSQHLKLCLIDFLIEMDPHLQISPDSVCSKNLRNGGRILSRIKAGDKNLTNSRNAG